MLTSPAESSDLFRTKREEKMSELLGGFRSIIQTILRIEYTGNRKNGRNGLESHKRKRIAQRTCRIGISLKTKTKTKKKKKG